MADQGWEQVAAEAIEELERAVQDDCTSFDHWHGRRTSDVADARNRLLDLLRQQAAEVARLRGVAELMRSHMSCEYLHHPKPDRHDYTQPCPVIARIDAALTPLAAGEAEG